MLFLQKETETEDIEIALHANTYHLKQNCTRTLKVCC